MVDFFRCGWEAFKDLVLYATKMEIGTFCGLVNFAGFILMLMVLKFDFVFNKVAGFIGKIFEYYFKIPAGREEKNSNSSYDYLKAFMLLIVCIVSLCAIQQVHR
jgi:hypothetical protein